MLRLCVLLAALAFAPAGQGADGVARVLGQELLRSELESAGDETAQVARFRDWIWERVLRHYVVQHGLAATGPELAELLAYDREFERRDRAQRARKLEELNQRLAGSAPGDPGRAWLEEFRRVLERMAERDAERDREPPPDAARQAEFYAPWVEYWKANRGLDSRYGGTVAATETGPVPHGARVALIADYERSGRVQVLDSRLRSQLFELLARPPAQVVPPDRVDFTPYWKLPIQPSYFPD